ncbi:hypothetical protein PG993_015017 [Apiospora rasikravindrae]|uniref:Uncharacterized protein n=1 Tax=Apiospora rasikravindrae TaxID=990691 RepID=A0ABR1RPE7_9PEZI
MAETDMDLPDAERIKERELGHKRVVRDIITAALQNPTLEVLTEAAFQLDDKCPLLDAKDDIYMYLTCLWEVIIDMARSPSVSDEVQGYLVTIVDALQNCDMGDIDVFEVSTKRVWRDLPYLADELQSCFIEPTDFGEWSPGYVQIWQNAHSFLARMTGAGICSPSSEVMDALRKALEQDISAVDSTAMKESRVRVACDWIKHSAAPLLSWATENIGYMDVPEEDTAAYCDNGPLYGGPHTMCLQRWGFWIERFQELGKPESGLREELREAVLQAAQTMEAVERSVGHTLSGQPTQPIVIETAAPQTQVTSEPLGSEQATTIETAEAPTQGAIEPVDLVQPVTTEAAEASTQVTFDPMDGGSME